MQEADSGHHRTRPASPFPGLAPLGGGQRHPAAPGMPPIEANVSEILPRTHSCVQAVLLCCTQDTESTRWPIPFFCARARARAPHLKVRLASKAHEAAREARRPPSLGCRAHDRRVVPKTLPCFKGRESQPSPCRAVEGGAEAQAVPEEDLEGRRSEIFQILFSRQKATRKKKGCKQKMHRKNLSGLFAAAWPGRAPAALSCAGAGPLGAGRSARPWPRIASAGQGDRDPKSRKPFASGLVSTFSSGALQTLPACE